MSEQLRREGHDLAKLRQELLLRAADLNADYVRSGAESAARDCRLMQRAAFLLRASTHPEQSARVEAVKKAMTALRCWTTVAEDRERTEPDPYNERPEVIGESLAALHGLADAFGLERKTHPFDSLEPASPTPTEEENR